MCLKLILDLEGIAGAVRKRSDRLLANRTMRAMNGNTVEEFLFIATWNMFSWTQHLGDEVMGWDRDVIALQETKLDHINLKHAIALCQRNGWRLHHGAPSPISARMKRGNKNGVGLVSPRNCAETHQTHVASVDENSPDGTTEGGASGTIAELATRRVDCLCVCSMRERPTSKRIH